ncbi:filaggrin-2-like [Vombatus ursinus]|uniref:filaggrin-2-like n=1 Tax=Vombatus ursinus TaxID=29139 RepID=UPI000FFCEC5D|nr:filaggrin-2-like [Vombatus ursinus]XP_027718300.1 filaggrin-2-like [Vombatus ursinus]
MSHLLTSIATIMDVFYQYCGQDEECDTMSQSALKEFLENELQFILKNPRDADTVDVFMLNMDQDRNKRIDFTEFLLMIFKLTMAFNKAYKTEYCHGHHEDQTEREEEEEEQKGGESDSNNSSWKNEKGYSKSKTGQSQETQEVGHRSGLGGRESEGSLSSSQKKVSKKINPESNSSNSGKSKDSKHISHSSKQGGRKQNSRTSPSRVHGGKEYNTDSENASQEGEKRYNSKRSQEDGFKKQESKSRENVPLVSFEEQEEILRSFQSSSTGKYNSGTGSGSGSDSGSRQSSGSGQYGSHSGQSSTRRGHGSGSHPKIGIPSSSSGQHGSGFGSEYDSNQSSLKKEQESSYE